MTLGAPPRPEDLVIGRWGARFLGRRFPVSIGRAGFTRAKREGDGASPLGVWRLERVFWRGDRLRAPVAHLCSTPIGPRMGWSDDPADPAYNRLTALGRGFSAERMRRADRLYDIVIQTDHNRACAPGAGSAIFVHVWRGPGRRTAGCVAFDRADLIWIMRRWRRSSRLAITWEGR